MQGLELARRYFETYGLPLLETEFAAQKDQIAAGLVGRGSECFGYDDEQSKDHDFEAGFCFWLTDEAEQAFGFPLMRAYNHLHRPSARARNGRSVALHAGICACKRDKRRGVL